MFLLQFVTIIKVEITFSWLNEIAQLKILINTSMVWYVCVYVSCLDTPELHFLLLDSQSE
jgi:hypothetical protein